jgi:predicted transcriptional regulator
VHENKQQEPAISVRKSVTSDFIICLEDGKKFKSLKRHLHTRYNMTPAEYRAKWGLPSDYPMVAPNYSAARSNLANAMGLGRKAAAAKGRRAKG